MLWRLRNSPRVLAVIRRIVPIACALVLGSSTAAFADSASISAHDAGEGRIQVNVSVTSTYCASSGYCGWFAYAVERHSSLSCSADETFLRWVGSFHEKSETEEASFLLQPFFPRATKLCVILQNGAGTNVAGEATIALPAGYGVQRSSGYNCDDFGSRAAAQYYFYLYPGDPSGLDADNDGAACEANKCPCGAEPIPAEPEPPAPPPVTVAAAPLQLRPLLPFISTDTFRCNRLTVSAGREGWTLLGFDENPFPNRIELRLRGSVTRPTKYVAVGSEQKIRWRLPAGRYRLAIRYPGDEWHLPSRTKILRPRVHRCRR